MIKKRAILIIFTISLLGILDASYLMYEHYANTLPPCSTSIFIDCGKVLRSKYSEIFGIPLSLYGLLYYLVIITLSVITLIKKNNLTKKLIIALSSFGFLFSLYLMYLQLIIIGSICLYCTFSALLSTLIFITSFYFFSKERVYLATYKSYLIYRYILRPILFSVDSESIHNIAVSLGKFLGNFNIIRKKLKFLYTYDSPILSQNILGIEYKNPIGLAAGFDYDANITKIIPSLGFGYQTVGTITNLGYEGNPKPRLGRLPKSKSLLVNKGFKNSGAKEVIEKLKRLNFDIPTGISIGRSNSPKLKTQKQSIKDIIAAFKAFEKAKVKNSYYELNISCPNLIHGNITFYPQKNLENLLTEVDKLKLKKPIFVKMPIEKSNEETLQMLKIISKHSPKGVIFGNLQRDKNHPSLNKLEVGRFKTGNYSGKPTFDRSNELIELAYKNFGKRFVIIGCGGVFNGHNAYEKIVRGASLIQLITGLIFEGPTIASKINFELEKILKENGFSSVSEAVGVKRS